MNINREEKVLLIGRREGRIQNKRVENLINHIEETDGKKKKAGL